MKRMLPFAMTGTLAIAAAAATAAQTTYTIDGNHSIPSFEIRHLGFSTYRGRFDRISGSVMLDPVAKKGAADVTIDAASISTGVAKLDEHLKTPDFFDVATYPTITFKSTSFRFKGSKLVSITGDLSMHGVSKPVTLSVDSLVCKVHPFYKVPACGADAHAVIKRADWGDIGKKFSPEVLGADVTLRLQIEAQNKQ
jgi:polyisoprenoid-binding protein YceI